MGAQEMGLTEEEEDVKEKSLEGDEDVEKIISQDRSIVDEQGKEQYMPDSQNKTLPMPSTIKSDMVNNNLSTRQPESQESISAANKNKVAIEVPSKDEDV